MSALETARNDGKIGSSLQASARVYLGQMDLKAFEGEDAASLFITSGAELIRASGPKDAFRLESVENVAVSVIIAPGQKCARCWKVSDEVDKKQEICNRCLGVLKAK